MRHTTQLKEKTILKVDKRYFHTKLSTGDLINSKIETSKVLLISIEIVVKFI
jgi:hypothetical protein